MADKVQVDAIADLLEELKTADGYKKPEIVKRIAEAVRQMPDQAQEATAAAGTGNQVEATGASASQQ